LVPFVIREDWLLQVSYEDGNGSPPPLTKSSQLNEAQLTDYLNSVNEAEPNLDLLSFTAICIFSCDKSQAFLLFSFLVLEHRD
jgi:hypothetical protein